MRKFYWVTNLLLTTIISTNLYAAANGGAGAPEDRDPYYEDDPRFKACHLAYLAEYVPAAPCMEKDKAGRLNPSAAGIKVGADEEGPIPHARHVYINGKLMQHGTATADMDVRVFAAEDGTTDFLSVGAGRKRSRTAMEAFANTRKDTYKGSREYPISTYKYKHKLATDVKLSFDRGHGIDHADTKEVRGLHSTLDVDNYTPQNSYYNRNIRRPLVDHIRTKKGTYKEIVIYGTNPLSIEEGGDTVKLPIGFVFLEFKDHEIFKAYYFPNLLDYKAMPEDELEHGKWKAFAKKFEIDISKVRSVGPFRPGGISRDNITNHIRQIFEHSYFGLRTLSGSETVFPTELKLPKEARAALIKHIALHHLKQSAELEFASVEYKLAAAATFMSKMKYPELDITSDEEVEDYHKRHNEALARKSAELGFNLEEYLNSEDYAFRKVVKSHKSRKWTRAALDEEAAKIKDPDKRTEFLETMKWAPVADIAVTALQEIDTLVPLPKEGQDIYDFEEAKYWVERAEAQVAKPSATIEEKIHLLEAYEDKELNIFATPEKIKTLEDNVEIHARASSTIDEKRQLIDYFGKFTPKGQYWIRLMLDQLKTGKLQDKIMIADHYGKFTKCNLNGQSKDWLLQMRRLGEMALMLYEEVLGVIDRENSDEIERINYCIGEKRKVISQINELLKA